MVVIAGDVPGVTSSGLPGRVGEGIPDGGTPAVLPDRAFDLVGGRGRPPEEALGEAGYVRSVGRGVASWASVAGGRVLSFTPRSPRAEVRWGLLRSA
jgi:hypothetical protein